eukprot:3095890-Ditylum_brightwellii.AAC.1
MKGQTSIFGFFACKTQQARPSTASKTQETRPYQTRPNVSSRTIQARPDMTACSTRRDNLAHLTEHRVQYKPKIGELLAQQDKPPPTKRARCNNLAHLTELCMHRLVGPDVGGLEGTGLGGLVGTGVGGLVGGLEETGLGGLVGTGVGGLLGGLVGPGMGTKTSICSISSPLPTTDTTTTELLQVDITATSQLSSQNQPANNSNTIPLQPLPTKRA